MKDNVSVKYLNDMYGVFANRSFQVGEIVCDLSNGEIIPNPTRTSIQLKDGVHVEDSIGTYINHSCEPTCKIEGSWIVAIVDFPSNTEVTFDYSQNEDILASPFMCRCCGGFITGSKLRESR